MENIGYSNYVFFGRSWRELSRALKKELSRGSVSTDVFSACGVGGRGQPFAGTVIRTLKQRVVPLDLVRCALLYVEADLLTEWEKAVEQARFSPRKCSEQCKSCRD